VDTACKANDGRPPLHVPSMEGLGVGLLRKELDIAANVNPVLRWRREDYELPLLLTFAAIDKEERLIVFPKDLVRDTGLVPLVRRV
jgi:hypothetical protein